MLEREQLSSTAFGPLAIPHALHLDASQTTISVLVSDKPIPWDSARVRLVAMLVLAPNGQAVFRKVLDELVKLLSKPANVDRLAGILGSRGRPGNHSAFRPPKRGVLRV